MKNSIKIMLAAFAVIVLGGLTASSAFGVKGEWDFASEIEHTNLTGIQVTENVFTVTGGTVKCKSAIFDATATGTTVETVPSGVHDYATHEITVTPTYKECTAFGQAATVTTNGCDYDITPTSTTQGNIKITCALNQKIVVKTNISGCTVSVGAQTPATPIVDFTEEGAGAARDILIKATVEGITYTSSGGICGPSGVNGKYTGTVTTKGYSDAAHTKQVGIGLAETTS